MKEKKVDYRLEEIASEWGKEGALPRPDLPISGSPERSDFRVVVETAGNELYLLEKIEEGTLRRKEQIANLLQRLFESGLGRVNPYLRSRGKNFLSPCRGGFWQLSPFITGVDLPRPEYVADGWRGKELARFLIAFRKTTDAMEIEGFGPPFSIVAYIEELMGPIRARRQDVAKRVSPALSFLAKNFFPAHDTLPKAFCHGDYHPLNVIWKADTISAVIDWEFCGYKPELYDAANLVGCIGIEDPPYLTGDLVCDFLDTIRETEIISEESWNHLHGLVIAIRFAWLSEWLRKDDEEMIEMEIAYMNLLIEHRQLLQKAWTTTH
jgi:homoserine kinase type II